MYPEKKEIITAALTPPGRDGLDALAESMKLSRSELLEKIGRGLLKVIEVES